MNIMSYLRINLLLICLMFGIPAEGTILGKSSDLNFVYDAATGKYLSQFSTGDTPQADTINAAMMSYYELDYADNVEFTLSAYSNQYDSWGDAVDVGNDRIYFRDAGNYLILGNWGFMGGHAYNPAAGEMWPRLDGTKLAHVWHSGHDNALTSSQNYGQITWMDLRNMAADSYLDLRFKGHNNYGVNDFNYNYCSTIIVHFPVGDLTDLPSMEVTFNTTYTVPNSTWTDLPFNATNTPASSAAVSWDAVNHRFNLSEGVWLVYMMSGRWENTAESLFNRYIGAYFYDEGVTASWVSGSLAIEKSNYDSFTDNTMYSYALFTADSSDDQVAMRNHTGTSSDNVDLISAYSRFGVVRLRLNE
jgi:hypothetical protein